MHAQELQTERMTLDATGTRWAIVFGAIGVVGLLASAGLGLGDGAAREVLFRGYLVNFMFFLSLALGALFFVLVTHLTRAGWSVPLRRIAEIMAWTVLPLAPLALVIVYGMHELYEWTHADVVAHDALLQAKQPYLNTTFFVIRLAFYFLVWNLLTGFFLGRSTKQDRTGDPALTRQMEVLAAPGMIAYALTVTFAAFDLMMSLDPHWYSTIYGVYYFSGAILGFLALIPLVVVMIQGSGRLARVVHTEHFHDLGRLTFAFVVFWAYIAFSQYMLIWYGNIPEETIWYKTRQSGPWLWLSLLLLFGHFLLPFLWLMSRHPKRRRLVLMLAGVWLLVMHWFDLFYLIVPGSRPEGSPLQWTDLTTFLGLGGIWFAALFWRLGRGNLVPVKDPRLHESLGLEHA